MHATLRAADGTPAIGRDRVAYTTHQTAALLSLSVRKVKALIASGELASVKIGRARRVLGSAIEAFARRDVEGAQQ